MRNKVKLIALTALLCSGIFACQKVPITGRKQIHLLPNSTILSLSTDSYATFLRENPPLPSSSPTVSEVQNVGSRISNAVEKFMKDKGYSKRIAGYKWEFNVVDSKDVNAFCMPGGKVVVYTGILPLTKDNAGLAVVLGHEIAHAIADHGNERMSQQLAVQLGGMSLALALQQKPKETQDIFLTSFGVGTTLGILAYSRQHELEADKLGLVFMAMAGYNPERAIGFWQDMSQLGGNKPPEFVSTHPSDARRINQVKEFLPEAMKYYNVSSKQPSGAINSPVKTPEGTQKPASPNNMGIKIK